MDYQRKKNESLVLAKQKQAAARGSESVGAGAARLRWQKIALRKILWNAGNPAIYFRLPDSSEVFNGNSRPQCGLRFIDRQALWRFIRYPGFYFGEGYSLGKLEVEGNLVDLLTEIFKARPQLHEMTLLKRFLFQGIKLPARNTRNRAKDNIHHHYDIGNDFYKLWLDKEMVYTCAYFPDPAMTLEAAQFAKMDYICRKLRLQPGETVVEAGCGWGALARFMAANYGVKVKAYNISREQICEARARAKRQGLQDQVEYIEDDYRAIRGKFDVFVSVGMLEHVGREYYTALGDIINSCLTDTGRGLIHSIGQIEAEAMSPWFRKRIFPGAYPPTLREMMDIFEPQGFSVQDVENLRLHYARTLTHWLHRYEQNSDKVAAMFDQRFVRTWRMYLASSIANFLTGSLQLYQIFFTRPQDNRLAITRDYLYQSESEQKVEPLLWTDVMP